MAINTGNDTPNATPAPAAPKENTSFSGAFAGSSQFKSHSRFRNLNMTLGRPVSRNEFNEVVNEYFKNFKDQLNAAMRDDTFKDNYRLVVMPHSEVGTPLTLILLTLGTEHNGENYLGVFSYVVEASNNPLAKQTQNLGNGRTITIDAVSSDVLNPEMWEVTKRFLQAQYGNSKVNYVTAGGMVLPREMKPSDRGDIHQAIYRGTQALYSVIEDVVTHSEEPFSVAMLTADKSITVQVQVDTRPAPTREIGGLPVRNDLAVSTDYLTRTAGMTSLNTTTSMGLTALGGYVDFEYVNNTAAMMPKPGQPGYNPYQPPPTQAFAPRYVITQLDTKIDAVTLETLLLSLQTAFLLYKDMNWALQFRPRADVKRKKGQVDWKDVGALGYAVNIAGGEKPEKIDTTQAFGDQELANLLQMAVFNDLIISMDVEEAGGLSWAHQTFIAAANGDTKAYNAIVEAANNLSNGRFKELWIAEGSGPIVQDDYNRVQLGYYIGADDERHDIRELDRLAIYNMFGGHDPQVLINWDRSWYDNNLSIEEKLDMRRTIAENVLSGYEIKGMARRVTFYAKFLRILSAANVQAGLSISQINQQFLVHGVTQRPTYNMEGLAMAGISGYSAGPFVAAGGNPQSAYRGGYAHYTGFWGMRQ